MAVLVKTLNGLAYASVKTRNGLAVASIKSINGLDTSGGSPVTFSDNFIRANENPLSKGGAWTNGIIGYGNMRTVSNLALGVSMGANNGAIVTTPSYAAFPNQSASVTLSDLVTCGVFVRFGVAGNGYRLYYVTSTSVRIARIDAGVGTVLGADIVTPTMVAGDILTLSIVGNILTASLNGGSLDTRSDAIYATGSPGIYMFGNTNSVGPFSCTSL